MLPGVGAFRKGIEGLAEMNLIGAVKDYAASGRPLLGICLGMQLFATRSYEFGETEGLDLIAGNVRKMPQTTDSGESIRVPFVGWAKVRSRNPTTPARGPSHPLTASTCIMCTHTCSRRSGRRTWSQVTPMVTHGSRLPFSMRM